MKKLVIPFMLLSLFIVGCAAGNDDSSDNGNGGTTGKGLNYNANFTSYKGYCTEEMATLFRGLKVNSKYCEDDARSNNTDYSTTNTGRWFREYNSTYRSVTTYILFSGDKNNMIVLSNKEFKSKLAVDDPEGYEMLTSKLNLDDTVPVTQEGFVYDFNDFDGPDFLNSECIWRYEVKGQNKIIFNHASMLYESKIVHNLPGKTLDSTQFNPDHAITCYAYPNDNGIALSDAYDTTGGGGDSFDITNGYLSTTSGGVGYKLTFKSDGTYSYKNLSNSRLDYDGIYTYSNNELYIKFVKGGSMTTEDTYTTTFDSTNKTLKLTLKESKSSGSTSTTMSYGLNAMFNAVNATEYTLNWNE